MSVDEEPPFVAGRPLVRAAFSWATRRHRGQSRAVDDAPFILHPVEVAALLCGRGCDDEVVAAGLLHDVIEKTDAGTGDVSDRFGDRVAAIVAAVTEDEAIEDYAARKAALRQQVAAAGPDAHAVFAADKLTKTRELRAQAASGAGRADAAALDRRLEHYEASLRMLETVAADLPIVPQLAFELWAMRRLPPRGHAAWRGRALTPTVAG
jgi:(p)ppGpp synthase/HD superfamily hydrolase